MNTGGKPYYHAVIAVREDSEIRSISDLAGHSFAFGSPLSTSSHLYPRLMLRRNGLSLDDLSFFSYYRHHDSAAKAVLTGEIDACGIRDVAAQRYAGKGLLVIAESAPIPNFPLVVSRHAPDTLRNILSEALLSLDPVSPEDSAEMSQWDVELRGGFAPGTSGDYDVVEQAMIEIFDGTAFTGDLVAPGAKSPGRPGEGLSR